MEKTKALLKNKTARLAVIAAVAAVLGHYNVIPVDQAEDLLQAVFTVIEAMI